MIWRFLRWLEGSRARALGVAVPLLAALGVVGALTGGRSGLAALYLVPVFLVAWTLGPEAGVAAAVAAAAVSLLADVTAGAAAGGNAWPAARAALAELAAFVAVALLAGAGHRVLSEERAGACTDVLTGIANRRGFLLALEEEIERGRRYGHAFAVAYLDLDDFKALNDRHGHSAGDEALRRVAQALRAGSRSTDLAARLGGDEFAVLMPETDPRTATAIAERIRGRTTRLLAERGWAVGLSVGVTGVARGAATADQVLAAADRAMYEAKAGGKGQVRLRRPALEPLGGA